MKIPVWMLLALLSSASVLFAEPPPALRAGVVQFELKNDIGLENADAIIPEILASYLKGVSKYNLIERVLLKKVFEEHALQMSGAIDDKMAIKVGQVFGIEAVVTGSAMKIGKTISITGRTINTQTGEILASGTVTFTDINTIESYLEELANLLSGISKDDLKKQRVSHELSKSKYGVRLGMGYAQNQDGFSGRAGLLIGLFAQTKFLDAEFTGIPPVMGNAPLIAVIANVNPFTHFGFGVGYLFCSDELSRQSQKDPARVHHHGQYNALLAGVNIRATAALRGGIYMGPAIASSIGHARFPLGVKEYWADYDGGFAMDFPPPAMFMDLEYSLTHTLSARFIFAMNGTGKDIDLSDYSIYTNPNPAPRSSLSTTYFILSMGYSFSL
jgi:hypothetical protein